MDDHIQSGPRGLKPGFQAEGAPPLQPRRPLPTAPPTHPHTPTHTHTHTHAPPHTLTHTPTHTHTPPRCCQSSQSAADRPCHAYTHTHIHTLLCAWIGCCLHRLPRRCCCSRCPTRAAPSPASQRAVREAGPHPPGLRSLLPRLLPCLLVGAAAAVLYHAGGGYCCHAPQAPLLALPPVFDPQHCAAALQTQVPAPLTAPAPPGSGTYTTLHLHCKFKQPLPFPPPAHTHPPAAVHSSSPAACFVDGRGGLLAVLCEGPSHHTRRWGVWGMDGPAGSAL